MKKTPTTKSKKVIYAALFISSLSLFLLDKKSTAGLQTRIVSTLTDITAIPEKTTHAIARKNDDDGEIHNDKSPNTTLNVVSIPSIDKKRLAKARARKRLTQRKILQQMDMTRMGDATKSTNKHSAHIFDNDIDSIRKYARIDVEREFNKHSFDQRRKLINASSALLWAADSFEHLKSLFRDELGLVPLDSPERQLQIWNDTTIDLVHEGCLCYAAQHFQMTGSLKDHVLLVHLNENWGALSGSLNSVVGSYSLLLDVPNRTVDWGTMEGTFGYCGLQQVLEYLANNRTRAVFTVQHQQMDHPKVHSLPLGIQTQTTLHKLLNKLGRRHPPKRPQLAFMSFAESPTRTPQMQTIIRNFNGTIHNTYRDQRLFPDQRIYYNGLETSKFVFSPSGLGWDCYRVWEALSFGAIPIIEHYNRTDGWFRTLNDLPVLWVSSFDVATPQLLETEYVRLAAKYKEYKYEKLTKQWWIDFVNSLRVTKTTATTRTMKKAQSLTKATKWSQE